MSNKLYESWLDFEKVINGMLIYVRSTNIEFDFIYAPPRGGLCLGVTLSHRLNIPLNVDFGKVKQEEYPHINSTVLVVDDILDTGNTLEKYKPLDGKIITWHYNEDNAKFKPDYFYKTVNQWVVYPWEFK